MFYAVGKINLHGKKASQSSEYLGPYPGPANNALDGNTNGDYFSGSCTHTASKSFPQNKESATSKIGPIPDLYFIDNDCLNPAAVDVLSIRRKEWNKFMMNSGKHSNYNDNFAEKPTKYKFLTLIALAAYA